MHNFFPNTGHLQVRMCIYREPRPSAHLQPSTTPNISSKFKARFSFPDAHGEKLAHGSRSHDPSPLHQPACHGWAKLFKFYALHINLSSDTMASIYLHQTYILILYMSMKLIMPSLSFNFTWEFYINIPCILNRGHKNKRWCQRDSSCRIRQDTV